MINHSHLRACIPLATLAAIAGAALIALATSPVSARADTTAALHDTSIQAGASQAISKTVTLETLYANLDKLKSYRARTTWSLDGKLANGKPFTSSLLVSWTTMPSAKRMHQVTAISNTVTSPDKPAYTMFETYDIEGAKYVSGTLLKGDKICGPAPALTGLFAPGKVAISPEEMQSLQVTRLIKQGERVNGILADQYAIDTRRVFTQGAKSSSGSLWVARDGGYIVKLTLQAQGDGRLLAGAEPQSNGTDASEQPVEVKLNIEYVVSDVNAVKAIELPAACLPAEKVADDIPLPKSATNVSTRRGTTEFQSNDKPEALVDFFKQALPAKGWKASASQSSGSVLRMVLFTKGTRMLAITIMQNLAGKGTIVMIQEK